MTLRKPGSVSRIISKSLSWMSSPMLATPVIFPPGWARLAARPVATGAFSPVPTIGTVRDSFCTSMAARMVETTTGGDDDSAWVASQQLSRKRRKAAGVAVRPAGLEHVILALHEADLAHAGVEHGHQLLAGACVSRAAAEDGDYRSCLLRVRGE